VGVPSVEDPGRVGILKFHAELGHGRAQGVGIPAELGGLPKGGEPARAWIHAVLCRVGVWWAWRGGELGRMEQLLRRLMWQGLRGLALLLVAKCVSSISVKSLVHRAHVVCSCVPLAILDLLPNVLKTRCFHGNYFIFCIHFIWLL
jgi:hypothetical protein